MTSPLQGKDMFEEFYKAELARRLLLQRFSSIDLEKAAIARLKTVRHSCFV
jgi:cullin-4